MRRSLPVALSERLYRILLVAFPGPFRRELGEEMVEVFVALAEAQWRERGIAGLLALWPRTLVDLARHGLGERFSRRRLEDRRAPRRGRLPLVEVVVQDARYGLRSARRTPGLAAAIVLTLALGIGATSAIVAVFDGVLVRPLPFTGSERVVILCETNDRVREYCVASPPNAMDWKKRSRTLETVGLARSWPFAERTPEGLVARRAAIATPGWFDTYGARPLLGRLLRDEDLVPGHDRVAVLTHAFWEQRFGGDRDVLGKPLILDGEAFTVVGVLPAGAWFHDFDWVDIWLPLTAIPDDLSNRDWRGFVALGRLAHGVSLEAARHELEDIRARLAVAFPDTNREWGVRVVPLREELTGSLRPLLRLFLAASMLVLLVACVNVANLLLVRAAGRDRELAVRASLGAGRRRLVGQLLTETGLFACAGGVLGLGLASLGTRLVLALAPAGLPRLDEVRVDWRVVLLTLALSAMAALLSGLAPAWRLARANLEESLRTRRLSGEGEVKLRRGLVVVELALALLLTICAGLASRGFAGLLHWQPGFDRGGLHVAWASLHPGPEAPAIEAVERFQHAALEMATLPGVTSVGLASAGPLFGGLETAVAEAPGKAAESGSQGLTVRWSDVGPGYFETLGLPLLRGRTFTDADGSASAGVAMVNETLARNLWRGDAVGRQVTVFDRTMEVVGVVADVPPLRPDRPVRSEIYWPQRQWPRYATFLVVRSDTFDAGALRRRLAEAEPDLQVGSFRSFTELEGRSLVAPRFYALLVGLFAGIALLLAAVGTYGVLSHAVASRAPELGVRMALGASPGAIIVGVVRSGLALAALGALLGVGGALGLGRLLESLLYGLPPGDPFTFATMTTVFLVIALLACWLPARRASRIDPLRSLRIE